jgi:DNA-binding winged helix-turn-helix (wHTH) protein
LLSFSSGSRAPKVIATLRSRGFRVIDPFFIAVRSLESIKIDSAAFVISPNSFVANMAARSGTEI